MRWDLPQEVLDAASADPVDTRGAGIASLTDVLNVARCLLPVSDVTTLAEAPFLRNASFLRLGLDDVGVAQVMADSAVEIASLRAALAD